MRYKGGNEAFLSYLLCIYLNSDMDIYNEKNGCFNKLLYPHTV